MHVTIIEVKNAQDVCAVVEMVVTMVMPLVMIVMEEARSFQRCQRKRQLETECG